MIEYEHIKVSFGCDRVKTQNYQLAATSLWFEGIDVWDIFVYT